MLINSAEIHGKIRHQYGIYDLGAQTLLQHSQNGKHSHN